jgi:pyruvate/2-oxoglutarate/acetoin dehydrogenase E1 component
MAEHKNQPMREALRLALRDEMLRDERVFVMGEEVGEWQGTHRVTRGLMEEFGKKRVRDTPISEMVIAGAAVGAAMAGLRPVAEMMTINFAFLALDAIVNHAAKIHYMFHRHSLAHARTDFRPFPRPAGRVSVHPRRCLRHVESRHPRR